ncbi:thioredoxin domain-containing protein 15 [Petromyzon marinus]|uniref:Thioredoxin domain-containing protein 15 n=1 Tax=Petromyzon marinus TaxID=7757 RepID=A0AAJ7TWS5_PETMA|nr:thioredoxin domain-containing protein 15 [Petromyzon marinus]
MRSRKCNHLRHQPQLPTSQPPPPPRPPPPNPTTKGLVRLRALPRYAMRRCEARAAAVALLLCAVLLSPGRTADHAADSSHGGGLDENGGGGPGGEAPPVDFMKPEEATVEEQGDFSDLLAAVTRLLRPPDRPAEEGAEAEVEVENDEEVEEVEGVEVEEEEEEDEEDEEDGGEDSQVPGLSMVPGNPVQAEDGGGRDNATEAAARPPKINCTERADPGEALGVYILQQSQDLLEVLNGSGSECAVVLFFAPWCQFSAGLAPHFNALARAFPSFHFVALDASQHSSLATRFGTVAVPNILLFQGAKPVARFNHTERTLPALSSFLLNHTGVPADEQVAVTPQDLEGPVPSEVARATDWLLVFSLAFIAAFLAYGASQTGVLRRVMPAAWHHQRQQHQHQD